MSSIHSALTDCPVIAAVRDQEALDRASLAPVSVIFILSTSLTNLEAQVRQCHERNKLSFVHLDMVAGLGKDHEALQFLDKAIKPEGIITTKPSLIKMAKGLGFVTVERVFLIDSLSIETGITLARSYHPDYLEVMPGTMPEVIEKIRGEIQTQVLAGGIITRKQQIYDLMRAGVAGVSTSNAELWYA